MACATSDLPGLGVSVGFTQISRIHSCLQQVLTDWEAAAQSCYAVLVTQTGKFSVLMAGDVGIKAN